MENHFRIVIAGLSSISMQVAVEEAHCLFSNHREKPMSNTHTQYHQLKSLSAVERKEFEELKLHQLIAQSRRRERSVYLGYVAVAILSTLLISGAMNFDQWKPMLW